MGYRIIIEDKDNNFFYGTKLYGYVDHEKCLSYKYLVKIEKFTGEEFFFDCIDNEITLSADQFNKFIHLYSKEWEKEKRRYGDWDNRTLLQEPEIIKLLSNNNDKRISWG